jgi:N-acetylglucosamine malate deacetylase 1
MNRTAIAIAAHPDDIEIWMAGTLLLLRKAGWNIHYMNISSGSLGSTVMTPAQTRAARRKEAKAAAKLLGATWHPPFCDDMEIIYANPLVRKVAAVVRRVNPSIVLTHPPQDYMEDHTETCRLAVTAAFTQAIPHYPSTPMVRGSGGPVAVYHCMPHMLCTPLGERVHPGAYVDVTSVMETKTASLAAHASQKEWLDASQGMDSYLAVMQGFMRTLGKESRRFKFAEGWRQHLHAGFGPAGFDPLGDALGAQFLRRGK